MGLEQLRFAVTHPMHTHPYNPAVASGAGVIGLAVAAEKAGFHGFGFTDHPAPSARWLAAGGHDALDPFVAMSFAAAHTTTLRMIPTAGHALSEPGISAELVTIMDALRA